MKYFSKLLCIGGTCLILFLVLSSQAHADASHSQLTSSYSVLGSPTVSATFINQVLAFYHSPVAGKGQALYLRTSDTSAIDFAIKEIEYRVDVWRKAYAQTAS